MRLRLVAFGLWIAAAVAFTGCNEASSPLAANDSSLTPTGSSNSSTMVSNVVSNLAGLDDGTEDVTGTATAKCIDGETRIKATVQGLVPNGLYTIWVGVFEDPGFDGTNANRVAFGALGENDGSENAFSANPAGAGQIQEMMPTGSLSRSGTLDGCLLDEFEFHIVGFYHTDGQTHGPTPGPGFASFRWIMVP